MSIEILLRLKKQHDLDKQSEFEEIFEEIFEEYKESEKDEEK